MSSRPGPRPHLWLVKGEIPHQQYIAWQRMSCQARFRGEEWQLTFEQFQTIWGDQWSQRGRRSHSLCLTRRDPEQPWDNQNTELVTRLESLRRGRQLKELKQHGS